MTICRIIRNYPFGSGAANNGASISGSTITITRTAGGFGSTSASYKWDDADYTTGQTAVSNGYLALNGAGAQANSVTISTAWSRNGSGKSFRWAVPSQGSSPSEHFPQVGFNLPSNTRRLYKAFWERWTRTSGTGRPGPWKHTRNGSFPQYDGVPKHNITRFFLSDLTESFGMDSGYLTPTQDVKYTQWDSVSPTVGCSANVDNYIEVDYKLSSTPGASDGHLLCWVNGFLQINMTGRITDDSGSTDDIDYDFLFVGMDYGASTVIDVYRDKNAWEIEAPWVTITDNATYSSSTKFAHVRKASQSDTQIIGDFDTSEFTSGQTVHAHIRNGATVLYHYSAVMP